MPALRILAALFGPRKARLFRPTSWPTSPVVHHGPRERLPAPFRHGDLSGFLRLAATVEGESEAGGTLASTSGFRGDVLFAGSRGSQRASSLRTASPSRLLQAGLNVQFSEFRLPSLDGWLAELARQVGIDSAAIRLYAFAAPNGRTRQGTDIHWDPNEVIHVQLEGTKTMRLAPNASVSNPDIGAWGGDSYPEDLVGQFRGEVPKRPPRKWRDVRLTPGSVVYFPRGYWHQTTTEGASFGVTLGFYWPTPTDVAIDYLRSRMRQRAEWRVPLFGLRRGASAHAPHEARLASLMERFGLPHDELTAGEALARTLPRAMRLARDGGAGRYVGMPLSLVRRRRPSAKSLVRLGTNKNHDTLEIEVPNVIADAIEWIARQRASFTRGDLARIYPALEDRAIVELLDLLIEIGAVQFEPRKPFERQLKARRSRS